MAIHVWEMFIDLHNARTTGMGPAPITYQDIQAFIAATGVKPQLWEIQAIKKLDMAWLSVQSEQQKKG